jgi:hypothetical protein
MKEGRVHAVKVPSTFLRTRLPSRSLHATAFTLVEVVTAITILTLILGSVYALLRQSFQTAADLQQTEREDQGLRRFMDLCRTTLETLPPDSTLSLLTAEETGTAQELTLSSVPEAFSAGPEPNASSDLILGLRMIQTRQTSDTGPATYQVAISREEFAPKAKDGDFRIRASSDDDFYQADDKGRYWLPLLSGIRSLEWRFWNEQDRLWEDDWSKAPDRPTLLEMQLWPEGRISPLRAVFSIPVAQAAATDSSQTGLGTADAAQSNEKGGPPRGDRGNAKGNDSGKAGDAGNRGEGRDRGRGGSREGRSGRGDRGRGSPDGRPQRSPGGNQGPSVPQPGRPGLPSAPRPGNAPAAPVSVPSIPSR